MANKQPFEEKDQDPSSKTDKEQKNPPASSHPFADKDQSTKPNQKRSSVILLLTLYAGIMLMLTLLMRLMFNALDITIPARMLNANNPAPLGEKLNTNTRSNNPEIDTLLQQQREQLGLPQENNSSAQEKEENTPPQQSEDPSTQENSQNKSLIPGASIPIDALENMKDALQARYSFELASFNSVFDKGLPSSIEPQSFNGRILSELLSLDKQAQEHLKISLDQARKAESSQELRHILSVGSRDAQDISRQFAGLQELLNTNNRSLQSQGEAERSGLTHLSQVSALLSQKWEISSEIFELLKNPRSHEVSELQALDRSMINKDGEALQILKKFEQ